MPVGAERGGGQFCLHQPRARQPAQAPPPPPAPTEVADDVDDAKDEAALGKHGDVGAALVVGHGALERAAQRGDVGQVLPHGGGGAQAGFGHGVDLKGKQAEGDEDDDGVEVGGHERGLEAAVGGVHDDAHRDQH